VAFAMPLNTWYMTWDFRVDHQVARRVFLPAERVRRSIADPQLREAGAGVEAAVHVDIERHDVVVRDADLVA